MPDAVFGRGVAEGFLTPGEVAAVARDGLAAMPFDGCRVLVIIPDGTRTMPMPLMFDTVEREVGPRAAAIDYLVALGTHTPMSDAQLTAHVGRPVCDGRAGSRRIFNHRWDDPATFTPLGVISARDVADLTDGRLHQEVPVALNRLATEYDHILICGPVFPHETAGFSGGGKYLYPGIAGPGVIHFMHWLGALITSSAAMGTADNPVRALIDRAASLLDTPVSLLALVVSHDGVAGLFCGDLRGAWRQAAALSSRRHIVWLDAPYDRVLAVMPAMYDDLWTAAKGTYKTETVVADGGEVIIYAPHVTDVSRVHGRIIGEVGYHCRDYFLGQWDRFREYPGGILAHSTHVKGLGTYDGRSGVEHPRIEVTLATGISRAQCEHVNLRYKDPARLRAQDYEGDPKTLIVPRAGEMLYRLGKSPVAYT